MSDRTHSTRHKPTWRLLILGMATALAGPLRSEAVVNPTAATSTVDYVNLPVSNTELRVNIHRAGLIVRAKIAAYKPPTFEDHVGTVEETTVVVERTYKGKTKAGKSLTYICVCHQVERPPSPADRVGQDLLLFLRYDNRSRTWGPATQRGELYFTPELEARLGRMLAKGR